MARLTFLTTLCLLLFTTAAVSPPQGVQFRSYNLRNVLEWIPGPGTPNGTRYTVEYAMYGDEEEGSPGQLAWKTSKQCRRVARTFCDLSSETENLEEKYYGRVRALGGDKPSEWILTERFDPRSETTFGPPTINITLKGGNITIQIHGPLRWKSKNSEQEQPMSKFYPQMRYNLTVYNNRTKSMSQFILQNNMKELGLLDFNTQYCVSASTFFFSGLYKVQDSQPQCVTTSKDPNEGQLVLLILGAIVPTVIVIFLLFLVVFFVYHYIFKNKERQPRNLLMPHLQDSHQMFCPEMPLMVNFINITKTVIVSQIVADSPKDSFVPCLPPVPPVTPSEADSSVVVQPVPYASQHTYRGQEMHVQDLEPQLVQVKEVEEEEVPTQGSDYGFVMKAPLAKEDNRGLGGDDRLHPPQKQGVGEVVDPYKQQWQPTLPSFLEDPDKDEGTIVNWDPDTRRLQIPLLSEFDPDSDPVEDQSLECDQVQPFDILSNVYIRQSSMGSNEFEDDLTKMENTWALWVNMGK